MNTTHKGLKKSIFSDITSSEQIMTIIGKEPAFVNYILKHKEEFYRTNWKKEKNKEREINQALHGLRHIHDSLQIFFNKRVKFPKYIHGSVKHKSPKTNAIIHIGKAQVLKFDLKDFYPSIKTDLITKTLKDLGMAHEPAILIAKLCTFKECLPQGITIGPMLANLVLLPTSKRVYRFCKKHKVDFSVYMDDLTNSGNKKLDPYWGTIKQMIQQASFTIAKDKTKFMNKNQAQISTKVSLNTSARPQNEYLKKLKTDIKKYMGNEEEKNSLLQEYKKTDLQMYRSLRGKINYVKQYNKKMAKN